jgi:hypothetical protein
VAASEVAMPRLQRLGHTGLASLDAARERLPKGIELLECEGTKTGETWLVDRRDGTTDLAVCDAFFNVTGPMSKLMGLALRALKNVSGLCIGNTFRWFCLRDERRYHAWLRDTVAALAPQTVAFCHGEPLEGSDCSQRLIEIASRRLRG